MKKETKPQNHLVSRRALLTLRVLIRKGQKAETPSAFDSYLNSALFLLNKVLQMKVL